MLKCSIHDLVQKYNSIIVCRFTSEVRHGQAGHYVVVKAEAVVDPQMPQTDEVFEQQLQSTGGQDVAVPDA